MKLKSQLLALGWVDKGDVLVKYSNPRLGWKLADGTLIVGYHEVGRVHTLEELQKLVDHHVS